LESEDYNNVEIKAYGDPEDRLEGRYDFYQHQSGCFSWYKNKVRFEMDTPTRVTDLRTQNFLISWFHAYFTDKQQYFLDEETEKKVIGMLVLHDELRPIILEKYQTYYFSAGSANRLFNIVNRLTQKRAPISILELMNHAGPWQDCPDHQLFDRSTFNLIENAVRDLSDKEISRTIARIDDFSDSIEANEEEKSRMGIIRYDYPVTCWGGEDWRNII